MWGHTRKGWVLYWGAYPPAPVPWGLLIYRFGPHNLYLNVKGDLVAQFRQVCANIQAVMNAAGGDMTDVVKLTIYVLDVNDYKQKLRDIGGVYREYFGKHFPAMTLVGARDLFDAADGCVIEIEGVAALA